MSTMRFAARLVGFALLACSLGTTNGEQDFVDLCHQENLLDDDGCLASSDAETCSLLQLRGEPMNGNDASPRKGGVDATSEVVAHDESCGKFMVFRAEMPFNTCNPYPVFPGVFLKFAACSDPIVVFLTSDCSGEALVVPDFNLSVGHCFPALGTRENRGLLTCNSAGFVMTFWSMAPPPPSKIAPPPPSKIAPPPPSKITCSSHAVAELEMTTSVNASIVDLVAFDVAHGSSLKIFATVVAVVEPDGRARASLRGLRKEPSTYSATARAHLAGEQDGYPPTWSTDTAFEHCAMSDLGESSMNANKEASAVAPPAGCVKTRWLGVYRGVNGNAPDFLSGHNAADLDGGLAYRTSETFTRYCVEVVDMIFPDVITASHTGIPAESPFVDYASCKHGKCTCMVRIDRSLGRYPEHLIRAMCINQTLSTSRSASCDCSEVSDARSSRYVGRFYIPLPYVQYLKNWPLPSDYPLAVDEWTAGAWYSFPAGGQCAPGAQVGDDGCTWRLDSHSYSVHKDDATNAGWQNHLTIPTKNRLEQPTSAMLHNSEVYGRLFQELVAELPQCGPDSV